MQYKTLKSAIILTLSFMIIAPAYALKKYEDNKLIIKFKQPSSFLNKAKSNSKIDEITTLIGDYKLSSYIDKKLISLYEKKIKGSQLMSVDNEDVEGLKRIFKIEYSSRIDPAIACRKLSAFLDIEYCEVSPIHYLVYQPNDTLVSGQYYLPLIKAFDAWDKIDTSKAPIIVGIVDTGIDYTHEDLTTVIYNNPGETGLDSNGKDKRFNGIDDDHNGYIDDWHGWDFVSSTDTILGQDNNPMPGHAHGTHVAGTVGAIINNITGIAGVAPNVRLMPVKIGYDNPWATSVANSYDGVFYASLMGAKIINCSWGTSNKSSAEQDVIKSVNKIGTLVVCAAGNNGSDEAFYPAAYFGSMSVAASNSTDGIANFSNYNGTVDVSAPGVDILATIPGNSYETMSGTSMASPVTSAVAAMAAMKHPELTPVQLKEFIKASGDIIDTLNPPVFLGKMGRTRVNAFKTVTNKYAKSLIVTEYTVTDSSNDQILEAGELVSIKLSFQNILAPVKNIKVLARELTGYTLDYTNKTIQAGDFATGESKTPSQQIIFRVPADIPPTFPMDIEFTISDDTSAFNKFIIRLIFSPAYRTLKANNLSITFNSRSNIGFNDYPTNTQGDGFTYKGSSGLLYEGGLMISSQGKLSDQVRGWDQSLQDFAFNSDAIFQKIKPGKNAAEEGDARFYDLNDTSFVGVKIHQHNYQFDTPDNLDYMLINYEIENSSGINMDSLYSGLFFDWDIGPSGSYNLALYDTLNNFGYAYNTKIDSLPWVGAALISNQSVNFFAIDNDGNSADNPGIYGGFSPESKKKMLTGGIGRSLSNITDISFVIGAGPMKLKPTEIAKVTFALMASPTYDGLVKAVKNARLSATKLGIGSGNFYSIPKTDSLWLSYPNPVDNQDIVIRYSISDSENVTIELYNSIGEHIELLQNNFRTPGFYDDLKVNLNKYTSGRYFIRMITPKQKISQAITIIH